MKFTDLLENYKLQHRPSEPSDEVPSLDKICAIDWAPSDLFERPKNYLNASGISSSELNNFMRLVKNAQGKPETKFKIYRGAPSGGILNTGDWVTPFKSYALNYAYDGSHADNKDSKVYEYIVSAKDLTCDFDSLAEWGYFGPTITGKEI